MFHHIETNSDSSYCATNGIDETASSIVGTARNNGSFSGENQVSVVQKTTTVTTTTVVNTTTTTTVTTTTENVQSSDVSSDDMRQAVPGTSAQAAPPRGNLIPPRGARFPHPQPVPEGVQPGCFCEWCNRKFKYSSSKCNHDWRHKDAALMTCTWGTCASKPRLYKKPANMRDHQARKHPREYEEWVRKQEEELERDEEKGKQKKLKPKKCAKKCPTAAPASRKGSESNTDDEDEDSAEPL